MFPLIPCVCLTFSNVKTDFFFLLSFSNNKPPSTMQGTGILAFLSLRLLHIQAMCTTSISEIALFNHTIKSHYSSNIHDCHVECRNNPLCRSINYYVYKRLCQHNNRTISERPNNKIKDIESTYIDNPFAGGT